MLKKGDAVSKKEYGADGKSKTPGRGVHLPGMYNEHRDAGVKAAKPDMMNELKTLSAFSEQSGTPLTGANAAKKNIKADGANDDFMALMPQGVKDKNAEMQAAVVPALQAGFGQKALARQKTK